MRKPRTVARPKGDAGASQHTIPGHRPHDGRAVGPRGATGRRLDHGPDGGPGAAAQHGLPHPQHPRGARRRASATAPAATGSAGACGRLAAHVPLRARPSSISPRSPSRSSTRVAVSAGHSVKLSVLDGDGVLVLAAAQGRRPYALGRDAGPADAHQRRSGRQAAVRVRAAGAAGGLALAPLAAFTARTITDPRRLEAERRASGGRAGRRTAARARPASTPTRRRSAITSRRVLRR